MIRTSCRLSLIITPLTPLLKVRNKKESATTVMIYNSFLTPCTELRTKHFSRLTIDTTAIPKLLKTGVAKNKNKKKDLRTSTL